MKLDIQLIILGTSYRFNIQVYIPIDINIQKKNVFLSKRKIIFKRYG